MKRLCVITGSTGGIGSSITRRLSDPETALLIHSYSHLPDFSDFEIHNAHSVTADLSASEGVSKFFADFEEWVSGYNIPELESISFIFAAGTDLMSPAVKVLPFALRMEKITALDLYAPVLLARQFAQWHKKHRSGKTYNDSLLFFSWDGVQRGMEGDTAQLYSLAKGGLESFARSFAQEMDGSIRILTISPGWIATTWGKKASEKINNRVQNESLAKRWGNPDDAAELAAFLISEKGTYLNGVNIPLNGGFNFVQRWRNQ